jgi:GNAT superfamily N-acetyltransferase
MSEIIVRQATLDDAEFVINGNARMALETEARTLNQAILQAGVRAVFDDPARGFYLIAELDGRPAGQMMITYEWSDWRNGVFWWIQSVYTIPKLRGRGVFKALYARVNAMAQESGEVCGLRLYVEWHNQRAQGAYLRCGMSDAIYRMFEVDYRLRRSGRLPIDNPG